MEAVTKKQQRIAYQVETVTVTDFYRYYQEMYFVAKRVVYDHYLAEDVVQEAMIKAYRYQKHLSDQTKLRAWLRTIVIRTAIDVYRKEKKMTKVSIEEQAEQGLELIKTDDVVCQSVELMSLCEALTVKVQALPEKLRQVVLLKAEEDLSDQMIADRLNLSLSAVKTRLHRARKQLRDC